MPEFKSTKEIRTTLARQVMSGAKIPFKTSQPLIRLEGGTPVLCLFAFTFSAGDVREGEVGRPRHWACADMETGAVLGVYACKDKDFSDQEAGTRYSTHYDAGDKHGSSYFDKTYAVLDDVRRGYVSTGTVDRELYRRYFTMVTDSIPPDYRVFYRDLGSPDSL